MFRPCWSLCGGLCPSYESSGIRASVHLPQMKRGVGPFEGRFSKDVSCTAVSKEEALTRSPKSCV